jgi:hypothetical protein
MQTRDLRGPAMPEPHLFRRAAEAKDIDLARSALREDVVLHSPVLFRPFEGRDVAMHVIATVAQLLPDLTYVHEVASDDVVALHFTATIGDLEIEGIDLLELDEDGLVRVLTVFMRPLTAVTQFRDAMAERLGVPS